MFGFLQRNCQNLAFFLMFLTIFFLDGGVCFEKSSQFARAQAPNSSAVSAQQNKEANQALESGTSPVGAQNDASADVSAFVNRDTAYQKVLGHLLQNYIESRPVATNPRERAEHADMLEFYANFSGPVWVNKKGLNAKGLAALKVLKNADTFGLKATDYKPAEFKELFQDQFDLDQHVQTEFRLSQRILDYIQDARGGRFTPSSLSSFLDIKLNLGSSLEDLKQLAKLPDPQISGWLEKSHPQHAQFGLLKEQLAKLRATKAKQKTIIRVLLNMERWRYLPAKLANDSGIYIYNNIPELKSRIFKNDRIVFQEKMIVGKVSKKTPVFSDALEWIEIHPTWYIPNSIKTNDIFPRIKRGSSRILKRFNIKLSCGKHGTDPAKIDWSKVNIRSCSVTQPPSRLNVLGFFKFKFPNKHSVYMHDTDDKHLFRRKRRLMSHGCMRIQKPQKMAEILLGHEKGISPQRISRIVKGPRRLHKEVFNDPVPVHITYFTALVNKNGDLKTYPDYYGHDRRMARVLYKKGNLFPAPAWDGGRKRKRRPKKKKVKKDWRDTLGSGF